MSAAASGGWTCSLRAETIPPKWVMPASMIAAATSTGFPTTVDSSESRSVACYHARGFATHSPYVRRAASSHLREVAHASSSRAFHARRHLQSRCLVEYGLDFRSVAAGARCPGRQGSGTKAHSECRRGHQEARRRDGAADRRQELEARAHTVG